MYELEYYHPAHATSQYILIPIEELCVGSSLQPKKSWSVGISRRNQLDGLNPVSVKQAGPGLGTTVTVLAHHGCWCGPLRARLRHGEVPDQSQVDCPNGVPCSKTGMTSKAEYGEARKDGLC